MNMIEVSILVGDIMCAMNTFALKLGAPVSTVCEDQEEICGAVDSCNDLLLHKKFEECLETCQHAINEAKNFPEKPGSSSLIESLCVLAIQAYAELNRWQEALPFITNIYSGIEDCPAQVVHLCVLLHAHMRDFASCNAVSTIWLRNPSNFTNPGYHILVEIFLAYVLVPQQRWKDVGPFLQNCSGLQEDKRQRYQAYIISLQGKKEDEERKRIEAAEKKKIAEEQSQKECREDSDGVLGFAKQCLSMLTRYVSPVTLHIFKNLVLLSIFTYWIITRANFDMLSNDRVLAIFSSLGRIWKAMFSPFHLVKK